MEKAFTRNVVSAREDMMMNVLILNVIAGFIVMLISGILYYRKPERKWILVLLVIGIVSVVTAGIRMLLA
ncbi:hypothetical protein ACU80K_20825 [Bacillus mycoides]